MSKPSFLKTVFQYSMVSWLAFVISFFSTPVLTRVYDPAELGAISLFISAAMIFQVITLCGQDQFFARSYFEVGSRKKLIWLNLILVFISWAIATLLTVVFARSLSSLLLGEVEGKVNYFAVIMCSTVSLPLAVIRMSEQLSKLRDEVKFYGIQILLFNFFSKVVVVGVAFVSKDYNAYISAYVVMVFLIATSYAAYQFKHVELETAPVALTRGDFKLAVWFGVPVMLSAILFLSKDIIPRIVLREYFSLELVGVYASAISLASAINVIQSGFNSYFSAYFYGNYKTDRGQINLLHHSLMFIMALALVGMSMFSFLIVMLLGSKYQVAGSIFPLITLMSVGNVVSETTVHGINLANRTYLHVVISLAVGGTILGLSLLLIPKYGVLGAAVAFGSSGFVFYAIRTFFGQRYRQTIVDPHRTLVAFGLLFASAMVNYWLFDSTLKNMMFQTVLLVLVLVLYYPTIRQLGDKIRSVRARRHASISSES